MPAPRRPTPLPSPYPVARRLLAAAALCALGPAVALAQDQPQPAPAPTTAPQPQVPPELEPLEGRPVRTIIFKTPEHPDPSKPDGPALPGKPLDASTESLARNQLRLREGSPFSSSLVSDDISRLNRLGRFKRVEAHAQALADGSVELVYTVEVQPLITAIQSVGNRVFTDQEISSQLEGLVGTPVDPTQLNRAARSLEDRYREKGYYNALVTIDQQELANTGIVIMRIREGERTRVTDIRFQGNLSFSPSELRTAVKTSEAGLFDSGTLDNDKLNIDVASLTSYYRDRGYLDVQVGKRVVTSPNQREAIVNFLISEGPVYTLRNVIERMDEDDGEPRFTTAQLLGLMVINPGDVYSEDRLKHSVEAIKAAYGKLGYTDADVRTTPLRVPDKAEVDVLLNIHQGRRFRTGLIVIQGNPLTRDDVVRRNITLKPERPLDTTEAKNTENKLKQTNLFEPKGVKVTVQPEDPDNPGYRDVLVQVQETNTGKFAIGAGVNSDSGIVGQITLTQRSFDIGDVPDSWGEFFRGEAFRGGGQTFTIEALPGTISNTLSASLFEPALFESNYSGQIGGLYTTRDYTWYTERRYGGNFSVGERFGSRWSATIPVRIEQVELTSINSDAPTDYFKYQDQHLLSSVGLKFSRSSVDNIAFPTKGNKIVFGVNQFTSPSTWTALESEYTTYLKLSEDVLGRTTTLKLDTNVGYIPQSGDNVPFYERYYMGGIDFRGFGYRGVSPRGIRNDTGGPSTDPVGGTFRFFAGAEVRQPLYEDILSGVAFIDTGTVDDSISFSKYRVSVGVGLRILVPQVSPVPFAFDFGFPLLKENTDDTRIFTFTVDVPFR